MLSAVTSWQLAHQADGGHHTIHGGAQAGDSLPPDRQVRSRIWLTAVDIDLFLPLALSFGYDECHLHRIVPFRSQVWGKYVAASDLFTSQQGRRCALFPCYCC
jgi:hypothetical protein